MPTQLAFSVSAGQQRKRRGRHCICIVMPSMCVSNVELSGILNVYLVAHPNDEWQRGFPASPLGGLLEELVWDKLHSPIEAHTLPPLFRVPGFVPKPLFFRVPGYP